MKYIYILAISCIYNLAYCQEENNNVIDADALVAPSSVAFNLLGISTSSIDKPGDLTSFAASIQNASNNFTSIPSNYGFEILPYTLFCEQPMSTTELNSEKFKDIFKQTFTFSLGISNELEENTELPQFTNVGIGVKFSIFRPKFDDDTKAKINSIHEHQEAINNNTKGNYDVDLVLIDYENMRKNISNNKDLGEYDKEIRLNQINTLIAIRRQQLDNEAKSDLKEKIKNESKDLKFNRKGFFLDFAAGGVIQFQDQTFNKSSVSKLGSWLTGTWDTGKDWSFLGIARYLYQPDKIFADDMDILDAKNISTLDGGIRIIYKEQSKQKLSFSTEGLYRSVLNKNTIDSSWRVVLNASYDIGKNQALSLTFGKDFDNSLIKDGNLITALNYIIGFGSKRNMNSLL
ncbi:MAG: hypothetical protein ACOVQR_07145 [Flavobacterium sp.]|jgi:hypothetical protein|uniref:hypothetical protein n=1 Tax=Flavobacterium sp. TaxID=239 RepID=UPI003BA63119